MSNYTYVIAENSITLYNITNGNKVIMFNTDERYDDFRTCILEGEYEEAERLDDKTVITDFFAISSDLRTKVVIEDGVGYVMPEDRRYKLADAITSRIVRMSQEGFNARPIVNFLNNLYSNPSHTAVEELFLFLDASDLPITEDGHFIAYKIVRNDFRDIFSGKYDNSVGQVCEMPRMEVDDVRDNTCSRGLHFCSKEYLPHYGSFRYGGDQCVLVKINPADVVSIPSDYDNAKGRTCRYEVVGVMDVDKWREELKENDYTSSSVVDSQGEDIDDHELMVNDYSEIYEDLLYNYNLVFDAWNNVWCTDGGEEWDTSEVVDLTGYETEEIEAVEKLWGEF